MGGWKEERMTGWMNGKREGKKRGRRCIAVWGRGARKWNPQTSPKVNNLYSCLKAVGRRQERVVRPTQTSTVVGMKRILN